MTILKRIPYPDKSGAGWGSAQKPGNGKIFKHRQPGFIRAFAQQTKSLKFLVEQIFHFGE